VADTWLLIPYRVTLVEAEGNEWPAHIRWVATGEEIAHRAPRHLLDHFTGLSADRASPTCVLNFCQRFGVAGLCEHGLPWRPGVDCGCSSPRERGSESWEDPEDRFIRVRHDLRYESPMVDPWATKNPASFHETEPRGADDAHLYTGEVVSHGNIRRRCWDTIEQVVTWSAGIAAIRQLGNVLQNFDPSDRVLRAEHRVLPRAELWASAWAPLKDMPGLDDRPTNPMTQRTSPMEERLAILRERLTTMLGCYERTVGLTPGRDESLQLRLFGDPGIWDRNRIALFVGQAVPAPLLSSVVDQLIEEIRQRTGLVVCPDCLTHWSGIPEGSDRKNRREDRCDRCYPIDLRNRRKINTRRSRAGHR